MYFFRSSSLSDHASTRTPPHILRPVAVLGGGGHGPVPRAFHAQKGPRTFTPPPPPMHLSECPKVFGRMSQSCPRCPQNGFN